MSTLTEARQAIRIVLFSVAAAVVYGILHDQVTAHLCVEYFTIAHPPVFPTTSPFWLAIGWGILATWWVGLILGIGLAAVARIGPAPRLGLAEVRRPVIMLMLVSAAGALLSGIAGATLTATGLVDLSQPWLDWIPPEKHVAFAADAWAHLASYGVGFVGGVFVMVRTVMRRLRAR
jgi:hypothetical protein